MGETAHEPTRYGFVEIRLRDFAHNKGIQYTEKKVEGSAYWIGQLSSPPTKCEEALGLVRVIHFKLVKKE
ncbi:hypothetical protein ATY38_14665 [Nitrosomonas ureae]|nr:hypothetical protein ATY38_14665 [Nitrosomonas ureae]